MYHNGTRMYDSMANYVSGNSTNLMQGHIMEFMVLLRMAVLLI